MSIFNIAMEKRKTLMESFEPKRSKLPHPCGQLRHLMAVTPVKCSRVSTVLVALRLRMRRTMNGIFKEMPQAPQMVPMTPSWQARATRKTTCRLVYTRRTRSSTCCTHETRSNQFTRSTAGHAARCSATRRLYTCVHIFASMSLIESADFSPICFPRSCCFLPEDGFRAINPEN